MTDRMNSVKMSISDKERENIDFVANQLNTENKVDAVAFALAFTRTMIEKTSKDHNVLLLKDEKTDLIRKVQILPTK